jgi:hypothetical protein
VRPWRFPCPAAPRTPGQGPFTPKHDSMHGTHAGGELRPTTENPGIASKACDVGRQLHWVVRPGIEHCKTCPQPPCV